MKKSFTFYWFFFLVIGLCALYVVKNKERRSGRVEDLGKIPPLHTRVPTHLREKALQQEQQRHPLQ